MSKVLVWINPATHVVVPREPTNPMLLNSDDALREGRPSRTVYHAMIAAAPAVKVCELPPRQDVRRGSDLINVHRKGWNACLDAIIEAAK